MAIAGTITALITATLALGPGFSWWHLTSAQNTTLVGAVSAIIAVASALTARTQVTAGRTPRRAVGDNRDAQISNLIDNAVNQLSEVGHLLGKPREAAG
ncbi:MAG: hypothetical protein ACLPUO_13880 [Streptosporangiaceae bacterium]